MRGLQVQGRNPQRDSGFLEGAVFNGFNVRSEGLNLFENINENKGFTKVMAIIALVQVAITFVGGEFFSCQPFGLKEWLVIIVLAMTIIPVDLLRKVVMNKAGKKENKIEEVSEATEQMAA